MAIDTNYESTAEVFVRAFYEAFDTDDASRAGLAESYSDDSMVLFEGMPLQGQQKIMARFQELGFPKTRVANTYDSLPLPDRAILIAVTGAFATADDEPYTFRDTFVLTPTDHSFLISHQIFRTNTF
ncbi:nuclear transport factor 2 family protein [Kitasatospora viridis]|uniref:Transport factor 2 (NTF2)-like protein n=1 Tax=Kitasatospora viridis TaxID=281105 RepID=A0A561T6Z1_9ACTN|nr:nuclear transport factor 2 family protein [Kitasatospora viridis]TWF82884.1 transport factor 2 (NTF2)-like protein [Kitasatospora viridis]